MRLKVEDFSDQTRFRELIRLPFGEIVPFILDYLRRRTGVTLFFWSLILIQVGLAITIRLHISGFYELKRILLHSLLGLIIFPLLIIPVHELLHIIPYFLSGARKIRIGMDLNQYIFYVTAHRYVVTPNQFRIISICPFLIITIATIILIFFLPGIWKWSLSVFLLVHTTMCAGDFALINYYHINRSRKVYSWDDADSKETYFYEEI
jgi:hypothetical protein